MFDFSINIYTSRCMHRSVTTVVTGGMHFSEGEVWDDIQERLVCHECGEYVTEAEVRAAWGQVTQSAPISTEEKSDGNN